MLKISGYEVNSERPLFLSEVCIQASPDDLEMLVKFLDATILEMKKWGPKFGHEHFNDWREKNGAIVLPGDIIVVNPTLGESAAQKAD